MNKNFFDSMREQIEPDERLLSSLHTKISSQNALKPKGNFIKWLPMTAAACFLITAMVLLLPAVMQENVPFVGEEEAEFITAEHEKPAVTATAEILYADSESVVLAVTLEFSEPMEDFVVDDVFASWVTNGFYSAGESVTMTPYSATYVYSIFSVDKEISVGDIFTKTHTGTHNGEAWEAKTSVTVSRFNNEDLIITDEITLNPYHIRFITNEPDLIGDPYDTTIYFKTHCGNVFNTRDDLSNTWYSFKSNSNTWVLHRVEFAGGFGVHDIAAVILNGEEIPLAFSGLSHYTRLELREFWNLGYPLYLADTPQEHIQGELPEFDTAAEAFLPNTENKVCDNTYYFIIESFRTCSSCGYIFTDEQNNEIGLENPQQPPEPHDAPKHFIFPVDMSIASVSEWTHWDGGYWGHSGIDFSAPRGTEIYAAAAGKVVFADWEGPYGRLVIIEHENGLQTRYAHCSEFLVTEGQEVTQGELIALVGDSGAADGAQLHFEVRDGGGAIILNPRLYLHFE
jgi:hypothetical protein